MIWVFGRRKDPQVSVVIEKLEKLGVETFVVDYQSGPIISLELDSSKKSGVSIILNGIEVAPPKLIWRRIKLSSFLLSDGRTPREQRVFYDEWNHFFQSTSSILECPSFNSISLPRDTFILPQLVLAQKLGMNVPQTLVTTDLRHATKLHNEFGAVINKKPGASMVPHVSVDNLTEIIYTSRVTREMLDRASAEDFYQCPVFLQQEILKDHELRIFAFGDKVMAFRVDSQVSELSEVDWRRKGQSLPFFEVQIDDDLKEKILKMKSELKLFYGSFDFIVDQNGKSWFLECNPDGAYMWLDLAAEGKLTDQFAGAIQELYQGLGSEA